MRKSSGTLIDKYTKAIKSVWVGWPIGFAVLVYSTQTEEYGWLLVLIPLAIFMNIVALRAFQRKDD